MICQFSSKTVLKLAIHVLGVLTVVYTASSYLNLWRNQTETTYLVISIFTFIVSLLLDISLCYEADSVKNSYGIKTIEKIYHFAGGFLLLLYSLSWFINVFEDQYVTTKAPHDHTYNKVVDFDGILGGNALHCSCRASTQTDAHTQGDRFLAAIFGFLNGILYMVLGCCHSSNSKKQSPTQPPLIANTQRIDRPPRLTNIHKIDRPPKLTVQNLTVPTNMKKIDRPTARPRKRKITYLVTRRN